MKKHIGEIAKDLKNACIFTTDYAIRDGGDILKRIEGNMAEINCKRILVMLPVFLVVDVIQIVILLARERHETFVFSMTTVLLLMAQAIVYAILIVWKLYIEQFVRIKKYWNCNILYHSFWVIWLIGTAYVAFCNLRAGFGGGSYIFLCIVFCLVPLYPIKSWILSLILPVVLALLSAFHVGEELRFFLYNWIVMFILGFIAQLFERFMWIQNEYIYVTAFLDPLTGLLNRRGGNAYLQEEMEYRNGSRIGVIMLDVDFFKKYNDSLGHDEGDNCLKMVSSCIREAVGNRTRLVVRHGGEEFVVILFDATKDETVEWAEKIRRTVYDRALPTPYREVADVVTVSVGATVMEIESDSLYEYTLKTADMALYAAKEAGRNQVVFQC